MSFKDRQATDEPFDWTFEHNLSPDELGDNTTEEEARAYNRLVRRKLREHWPGGDPGYQLVRDWINDKGDPYGAWMDEALAPENMQA